MIQIRPISILPIISKIMERHVHDSLYDFLSDNDLMCKSQFGLKKITLVSPVCLLWLTNGYYN